ncbi:MAG: FAD-binding oxidoreductase [Tateyamaria sp.]|nr:FAD-binding oxidoreductase [Tateyamaria sp.]
MKVIIIGGGIIGAALAQNLKLTNADVTVIDIGGGATIASFGWLNASFFLNHDHFKLRLAGLDAWRRLGVPLTWSGALCWEKKGKALEEQFQSFVKLGYHTEFIDEKSFLELEPHVCSPRQAIRFGSEGVAEPRETTQALLRGVKRLRGIEVLGITTKAGHVTGVDTVQGQILADRVIVASGTGSPSLLKSVDVKLPMQHNSGGIMRTARLPVRLSHVLVTPEGEVRQDKDGFIWTPTKVQHQKITIDKNEKKLELLADEAIIRLRKLLPTTKLIWEELISSSRPIPKDGLPVFGPAGPEGLFVAVTHSGMTLAAVIAELLCSQICDRKLSDDQANIAVSYGINRFKNKSF